MNIFKKRKIKIRHGSVLTIFFQTLAMATSAAFILYYTSAAVPFLQTSIIKGDQISTGNLEAIRELHTPSLDTKDREELLIGSHNANAITIGQGDIETKVLGDVKVHADLTAKTIYAEDAVIAKGGLAQSFLTADRTLQTGELVTLTPGQKQTTVKRATPAEQIAGVVVRPAHFPVDQELDFKNATESFPEAVLSPTVLIAFAGSVPVRVNLEGGAIQAGDALQPSQTAGQAMKAIKAGLIIGYAFEDYAGFTEENQGMVDALLGFSLWEPIGLSAEEAAQEAVPGENLAADLAVTVAAQKSLITDLQSLISGLELRIAELEKGTENVEPQVDEKALKEAEKTKQKEEKEKEKEAEKLQKEAEKAKQKEAKEKE